MKFHYKEDTITALSTPFGEGGIAVIRISGSSAVEIAERLYSPIGSKKKFEHFRIHYGHVINPFDGCFIDEALFLVMKSPYSYTREDVVEIQCHGGMVPVRKIIDTLNSLGVRNALPGEFTKRAFLNGRIDLLQAEAVMDVITAKTEKGLEMAEKQLGGKFSLELSDFKELILDLIARIEAPLDYPEENLYTIDVSDIKASVKDLLLTAEKMKSLCEGGKIYKDGVKISIIGKPNVGKSSLLNMLLGEQRAIVTEYAGTTRDTIEELCIIDSVPVNLCDTAGIHDTKDFVEKLGVEKTRESIERADFIIAVFDISSDFTDEDRDVLDLININGKHFIIVFNKSDLPQNYDYKDISHKYNNDFVLLSTVSLDGREEFKRILSAKLKTVYKADSNNYFLASQRHREALSNIVTFLEQAIDTLNMNFPLDMLTVNLRDTLSVISELCGESFDESILDRIFNEFCIGK